MREFDENARLRIVTHHQPGDEEIGRHLAAALQGYGYNLDKPEAIPAKDDPGVRFFHEEDRQAAEKLNGFVTNLLSKEGLAARLGVRLLKSQRNAAQGTIEIWLPPLARAAR